MTTDRGKKMYEGAKLRLADHEWTLGVFAAQAEQDSSSYIVHCHLTADGQETITGFELRVRIPENWPPEKVLASVQQTFDEGWFPENDALVFAD